MSELNERIHLRTQIAPSDERAVREIVYSTGFFRNDEIDVAVELVSERLDKGSDSGYEFIFAEINGKSVGYACYGLIPCTLVSFDLYWIATHNDFRGQGIGKLLLQEVEQAVQKSGGKGIYAETSSIPKYEPTRQFYLKNGYLEKVRFEDFYAVGDDKLVYVKYF